MTSDSEDAGISRHRIVLPDGHDNYKEWLRYLRNLLTGKDLLDVADGTDTQPSDSTLLMAWKKLDKKAFSVIDATLTQNVHDNLPVLLTEYHSPPTIDKSQAAQVPPPASSYVLLSHLQATYSAIQGSRQAELLRIIWRTDLPEGQDPTPHLAQLKSAYSAIVTAGATMRDVELTYAILMSLPPSFDPLVQSYYLATTKDSSSVINAIRTEWRRRDSLEWKETALVAKVKQGGERKHKGKRQLGPDESAWCENHQAHGHNTNNCRYPPNRRSNKPTLQTPSEFSLSANVAAATITTPSTFLAHTAITHEVLLTGSTNLDIVIDSGATHHMVHDKRLLTRLAPLTKPAQITVGNGATITATEAGSLQLRHTTLDNVLHVPALGRNLLSVGQAAGNQQWTFADDRAFLGQHNKTLMTASRRNGLFILDPSSTHPSSTLLASIPDSILHDWHRRLGHRDVRAVVQLGLEGRLDNKVDWGHVRMDIYGFQCRACIQGKGKRLPSPKSNIRATKPLYSVHVDLWGPARTPSLGGKLYFLTCYDDYTRKIHLTFLEKKSDTRRALINYINLVENQLDCSIKTIRLDRGGEFNSKDLRSYLQSKGIEHHRTPPTAHAQNGRVERAHLTLLDTIRTLLLDASLPDEFWAEAAKYAVYTRNRTPCGPQKKIPEDLWRQTEVHASHLQPFGCRAFYRDHSNTDKLRQRYREGRLLSYEEGTHNYRIWDPARKSVVVSRDVVFESKHHGRWIHYHHHPGSATTLRPGPTWRLLTSSVQ